MTVQRPPAFIPIITSNYVLSVHPPLSAPVLSSNSTNNNKLVSGTYVSLHCDGGGQSITRYIFYQGGKDICSEPHVTCRESSLYFLPITASDSGNYTCVIQNPVTSNTSNGLQLTVSAPVSDVRLTSNASGYLWPGINSSSLTCSARGTDVSYAWSLKGAPLPQDPRYQLTQGNSMLTISPVSANDDGPFTCTASNWINNATSNNLTFNLAANVSTVALTSNISETVLVGQDSVSLYCSADGTEVQFFWRLKGEPVLGGPNYHITTSLSPPSSTLTISPVSRNDDGPFTCEASNLINKRTSNAENFTLTWHPEEDMFCLVDSSNPQYVQLTCSWSGGQPPANVTMVFNGVTETGSNQVTRNVPTNSTVQNSTMMCYGNHMGKQSNCGLIFEPPQSPEHNNSKITSVTDGQAAVLTVTLQSGLNADFTWYHFSPDPVPIQEDTGKFTVVSSSFKSSLVIAAVTLEEAGRYECRAKNFIGSQTFLFTVSVEDPVSCPVCSGLGGGEVAGIVIGVIAGIIIIIVTVYFVLKAKKSM
ncbi:carcinoembryonic antigen-related cell adhesion molecule 1-like [Hyperolius riggenbachi]|uniref:carcinoembryonic antigen-related cell adhesion molecule 1-like n=1 Tax=Hyperolius riggenbachi TaxID=752182 RepID=UPI0035A2943E